MMPSNVNPFEWLQALGLARSACARIFRDGGAPADALKAFGFKDDGVGETDWAKAVEKIATTFCHASQMKRAA